jgi:poly-gamma-glutamate synthesis protein (capsule biosynthesis protein)
MARVIAFLIILPLAVAGCAASRAESHTNAPAAPAATSVDAPPIAEVGRVDSGTATSTSTPVETTEVPVAAGATTTAPPKGRLVVSAAGDVNLDPGYIGEIGEFGFAYPWARLQDSFLADDLSIVNLECAASELGVAEPKEFVFRCPPEALPDMRAAGVDVANLGNNHSGDFGKEALVDSRGRLHAAGIAPVGAGADAGEAHRPAIFEINGWTVAVLGFGGVVPTPAWIATDDRAGIADGDTIETMVAAVEAADEIADLVIVTIHWGIELDTTPRPEDVERAEAMIAAGADAVFGHHAHRLQPLEFVDGVPVAWGLGNFVWPKLSEAGSTTAIAQVVFEPDGSVRACLVPTYIEEPGQPKLQVLHDSMNPCPDTG